MRYFKFCHNLGKSGSVGEPFGWERTCTGAARCLTGNVMPKYGKKTVEKIAKGGSQAGKRFWVCPDYPE
jgi:hypothetical protein